ncbi:hypothetical protein L7F22_003580 [Adiantum nelumboides]|nr:hypothetical protein [Adiantum nelumboides]
MLEQVKAGDTMLLFSTAGQHLNHLQAVVSVPRLCVACGLAFMASHVVCLYTLACGHAYHDLCFDAWLGSEMVCADSSCKRSIPNSLKSMLLHTGSGHIALCYKLLLAHSVDSNQGTLVVKVEPLVRTAVIEPQLSKSSPKDDATVDDAKAVAQEGVDAVQCMVADDENPDSPIFLSDMVKVSKKRKNNEDGGPSKKNRPLEFTRSKQHAQHGDGDMGEREDPKIPTTVKKTPRKSTPLRNPSIVPKDAQDFIAWAVTWANVYIWSSAMLKRVGDRIRT